MRIPPFNPYITLIIGVLAVATSAILVKLADNVPAAIIANYRLLFAFFIISPIVLTKYIHEFGNINRKGWLFSILAGIFLAIHYLFWFKSLDHTFVANSIVFIMLQPIFTFVATWLFSKDRFSSGIVISIVITLFGSIIIGWGDFQISHAALFGDFLAILGAIAMTFYLLSGQQPQKKLSLLTYTFIVYGVSSIVLILYNVMVQNPLIGYSPEYWSIFLALAILPTFFGHILFYWSLKWLGPSTVSMATVFIPITATILAFFILGEQITWSQLLGGTIIIFGLFLFILSTSRKSNVTISKKENK
ncbi:DMT family transporter [Oceanobacillus senegalensis]|uniref:DMT family transporter n=1 Tax=Oceanobacillus senegalensis TaxID=1936063 RepID=UPI000A30E6F2|nr:DMT family transporter [Oceanobacillus senegalensis]